MKRHSVPALALLLCACGARAPRSDQPVEHLEMEAMVVEVTEEDGERTIEAFDAQQIFEEGTAAFQRHDFEACVRAYGRLFDKFPRSRFVHSALYNRGLCLEHLGQHNEAATHFRRHAQLATTLRDRQDGEFRWGYNLVKTGNDPTAIDLYTRMLAEYELQPADKAECHLRRGTALLHQRKFGKAERDLKRAMDLVREAYGEYLQGNELLAEAHFRRAEIYQALSHDVPLKLPIRLMKDDLREKVRFFRQAQSSYLDAFNVENSYWSTASGLKLGELYEQFYFDVLGAQVPEDFTKAERHFYFIELKQLLQPLLEQSLSIYEKNVTISERIGAENEWVDETEKRLKRLRGLIEETVRQKAAPPEPPPALEASPPPRTAGSS